jgi:hypothetical protein
VAASSQKPIKGLTRLEAAIDDRLAEARNIDREALADVIALLRTARNTVFWKMG